MEMQMVPLMALAAAALFMMFHGLGHVEVLEIEPAIARVVAR